MNDDHVQYEQLRHLAHNVRKIRAMLRADMRRKDRSQAAASWIPKWKQSLDRAATEYNAATLTHGVRS